MVRQRRARPLAQPGSWLGPRAWIIAGSLWVAACSSEVPGAAAGPSNGSGTGTSGVGGGASSTGAPGGTTTGTTSPSGTTGATPNPGLEGTSLPYTAPEPVSPALEARTWKLSHAQYQASIEALFGVQIALEDAQGPKLAPETSNGVFTNLSDAGFVSIANGLAEGYMKIAAEVSETLTPEQLASFGGCAALGATCGRDAFLGVALQKAFRRPASTEDLALFGALFDSAASEAAVVGDDAFAYRSVVKAMLTSPLFLYRTEIGADASQVEFQMTPHEIASFLSYSILGLPPSDALLAKAESGALSDLTLLRSEVDQLLAQPSAGAQFEHFVTEWLEVEAFLDPDFGLGRDGVKVAAGFDAVKAAMQQETENFIAQHITLDGSLTGLLTSPVQVSNPALAAFYDSEPTGAGAPRERVGILALGAGLSLRAKDASTSPTLRGLFIRERLMCQHFTVPPTVNPDLTELEAQAKPNTTRELYELHALDPVCNSCHELFDPLGFTLETFDEVGRFRSAQTGTAIDTTAMLLASDVDQMVSNHVELANALAQSNWVRECLSRQAFRFYFGTSTSLKVDSTGTRLEEDRGLPPIQLGRAALDAGALRAMVAALLSSESTFLRTRREPEQL